MTKAAAPPTSNNNNNNSTKAPRQFDPKTLETAALYLPDESEEGRMAFCAVLEDSKGLPIIDVLNAHFLFEDNPTKALRYLQGLSMLRELGFADEAIGAALLQSDLDADAAVDQLMKGGSGVLS